MSRVVVWFDMSGYAGVDLPDDYNESDIEKAQLEAEQDIDRNKYDYLTGSYNFVAYEVEK